MKHLNSGARLLHCGLVITYCKFIYHSPSLPLAPLDLRACLRAATSESSAWIIDALKDERSAGVLHIRAILVLDARDMLKFLSGLIILFFLRLFNFFELSCYTMLNRINIIS